MKRRWKSRWKKQHPPSLTVENSWKSNRFPRQPCLPGAEIRFPRTRARRASDRPMCAVRAARGLPCRLQPAHGTNHSPYPYRRRKTAPSPHAAVPKPSAHQAQRTPDAPGSPTLGAIAANTPVIATGKKQPAHAARHAEYSFLPEYAGVFPTRCGKRPFFAPKAWIT